MQIVHLHTGADGHSHLTDRSLRLTAHEHGAGIDLSSAVQGVAFRRIPDGWLLDHHNAPRRALVVQLSGTGELICGDGTSRTVGPGEVLLADDVTGQGHISRELTGPRTQAVIYLDPSLDLTTLFTPS